MLVKEILVESGDDELSIVNDHCRQFINESGGFPLFKNLSSEYNDVHRVKVRRQKKKNKITQTFNEAFNNKFTDLRQRALFAYASPHNVPLAENQEVFYVFPIDGFRFMYNTQVADSNEEYKQAFDTMFEQFDSQEQASKIMSDLLQYTYTSDNLIEGLKQGVEIIMYNLPFYYAIRKTTANTYKDLLTSFE